MAFDPARPNLFACMSYNPYVATSPELIPGYSEASPKVRQLIRDLVNIKRVVHSFTAARFLVDSTYVNGATEFSDDDINWAWAIGAGGGCEYEWEQE